MSLAISMNAQTESNIFQNDSSIIINTPQVNEKSNRQGSNYIIKGLAVGAGSGAAIGAFLGYADGDDPKRFLFSFTASEKAFIGGIYFGGIGAFCGLTVGTIAFFKDKYKSKNVANQKSENELTYQQELKFTTTNNGIALVYIF